jgi:hypothetical protein
MMIVPFYPDHLQRIVPQPSQVLPDAIDREKLGRDFMARGPCWTLLKEKGRFPPVLAVGGMVNHSAHHASLWVVLAANKRGGLAFLTQFMRRQIADRLGTLPRARMDMTVDPADYSAARWAIMLGFRFESAKRCYGPNGETMHEYVIIREGPIQ